MALALIFEKNREGYNLMATDCISMKLRKDRKLPRSPTPAYFGKREPRETDAPITSIISSSESAKTRAKSRNMRKATSCYKFRLNTGKKIGASVPSTRKYLTAQTRGSFCFFLLPIFFSLSSGRAIPLFLKQSVACIIRMCHVTYIST
jgi:hypothetical protein